MALQIPSSGLYIDNPAWPLLQAVLSYWGTTDAAGAAGGTSVIDSRCTGALTQPSFEGLTLKLLDSAAAGQAREIFAHNLATGELSVNPANPFTDNTGAVYQVPAGTRFCVLSLGGGGGGIEILEQLLSPRASLYEGWLDELGIDFTVWAVTHPATGAAWARAAAGPHLQVASIPNANETARLVTTTRWIAAPDTYDVNMVLRRLIVEFELSLANVANMDNTLCWFGLTPAQASTRATNNIIGFGLNADVLETVTDLAGAETLTTGFGEDLTVLNKLKMDILSAAGVGTVRFFLNEALIATHITTLPDLPMYHNYFIDTEAGGAATINVGVNRIWNETILR